MKNSFKEGSYSRHSINWDKLSILNKLQTWTKFESIDEFLHNRYYRCINPLLSDKGKKWLTVGDGYGTDSNYLIKQGIVNVLATDISSKGLESAKKNGFIIEYSTENAEKLSFDDECFDYVLCKEAYHHFPRPALALYEMLRVAKEGLILLEPNDQNIEIYRQRADLKPTLVIAPTKFQIIKDFIKDFIGIKRYKLQYPYPAYHNEYKYGDYEPDVANYVYTISEREIEKVALALNYQAVAFKHMSFYYEVGVETEKAEDSNPFFIRVKQMIADAEKECAERRMNYSFIAAIILKNEPDSDVIKALKMSGYNYIKLPLNPFV